MVRILFLKKMEVHMSKGFIFYNGVRFYARQVLAGAPECLDENE